MTFLPSRKSRSMARTHRFLSRRPCIERLEDRTVPSTLTVNLLGDTGAADANDVTKGDVRYCIAQADADAALGISDTINFDSSLSGQTIALTQGQLELSGVGGTITIDARGLNSSVVISGNHASRVFLIDSG